MMRIAYINKDEVNRELATRLSAMYGAAIRGLLPNDLPRDGEFDAVIYNIDDIPRALRAALLQGLCHGAPDRPVAIHGYDITDKQLRALRRNGIAAAQRIDADLIRSLCKAAQQRKKAAVDHDDPIDLTWVNVAQ
jgi:hypothetical protein